MIYYLVLLNIRFSPKFFCELSLVTHCPATHIPNCHPHLAIIQLHQSIASVSYAPSDLYSCTTSTICSPLPHLSLFGQVLPLLKGLVQHHLPALGNLPRSHREKLGVSPRARTKMSQVRCLRHTIWGGAPSQSGASADSASPMTPTVSASLNFAA